MGAIRPNPGRIATRSYQNWYKALHPAQPARVVHYVRPGVEKDLLSFPIAVQRKVFTNLQLAAAGRVCPDAKALAGFVGAHVQEIVCRYDGNTYRTIITVRFKRAVYVIDAFMKKSKNGSKLPKEDKNRMKQRLDAAKAHYETTYGRE